MAGQPEGINERPRNFFISYTSADRGWAEWIAWQLEAAGYSTLLQAWDFRPGTDFIHGMQMAATTAERTIAVLSPHYFASHFAEAEWRAAFAKDPTGELGLLVPVRVVACNPPGLLATRVYVDLVNADETTARAALLGAVSKRGARATQAPFPGATSASPRFPREAIKAAYRTAIESGDPNTASTAARKLGLMLEHDDPAGARTAYQQAIDSKHPDQAPRALNNLGLLLEKQGDFDGAQEAYRAAIGSRHPEQAPYAMNELGSLLRRLGNFEGAQAAYQQAIESGHPFEAPLAMANLGWLLYSQGDMQKAKALYRQAIDSGHPEAAPKSANNLGWLLHQQGDYDGARAAYQRAIDSGHPDAAPKAANNLSILLEKLDDGKA